MRIVDKVLDILNGMLPPENPVEGKEYVKTVIYDSGFSSNLRIDRKTAPYAIFYLLSNWNIDITNTTSMKEEADIQVFFCDKADLDAKGEDKDIIITRMELLAREFIREVLNDRSLEIVEDKIRLQSSYGSFDKFVVGVSANFKVQMRKPECL